MQSLYFFLGFLVIVAIIFAITISNCTYPSQRALNKLFKKKKFMFGKKPFFAKNNLPYNDAIWIFYALRAMSYRNLSNMHLSISLCVKIIGVLSTIITAFYTIGNYGNSIVIFFALLATLCSLLGTFIPCAKLAIAYRECADILEAHVYKININEEEMRNMYYECQVILGKAGYGLDVYVSRRKNI